MSHAANYCCMHIEWKKGIWSGNNAKVTLCLLWKSPPNGRQNATLRQQSSAGTEKKTFDEYEKLYMTTTRRTHDTCAHAYVCPAVLPPPAITSYQRSGRSSWPVDVPSERKKSEKTLRKHSKRSPRTTGIRQCHKRTQQVTKYVSRPIFFKCDTGDLRKVRTSVCTNTRIYIYDTYTDESKCTLNLMGTNLKLSECMCTFIF